MTGFWKNLLRCYKQFHVFVANFMGNHDYRYDVFISHAVEDKLTIANELCNRLEATGLKIWYSGQELTTGDSISKTISEGLNNSRYGIVILSRNYLTKSWPIKEFYLLLAKETNNRKVILPVIHDLTIEELANKDLVEMADRMGVRADKGIDHVVEKLLTSIQKDAQIQNKAKKSALRQRRVLIGIFVLLAICTTGLLYLQRKSLTPPSIVIERAIEDHINEVQTKITAMYTAEIKSSSAQPIGIDSIQAIFTQFKKTKAYHRNGYELFDGIRSIHFKKNVENALHIDTDVLTPYNTYGFTDAQVYCTHPQTPKTISYFVINITPTTFTIDNAQTYGDLYEVKVSYLNNIRVVEVTLVVPNSSNGTKKQDIKFFGSIQSEVYTFRKTDNQWILKNISMPEAK